MDQYPPLPFAASFPPGATVPQSPDEWSRAELAALCVGCALFAVNAAGLIYVNVHRDVRYVKILSVNFLNAAFALAFFYWFCNLTSTRLIPQTGAFLVCDLWNVFGWFGSASGVLAMLILRLYRLDLVIVQRTSAKGWRLYLLPTLLWLPFLAYSTAASVIRGDGPYYFPDVGGRPVVMCYMFDSIAYCGMIHLLLLAFVYITFAVRLRNARHRIFNEYWQSVVAFVMFVIAVVIYTVMVFFNYTFAAWGRSLCILLVASAITAFESIFIGRTIYNLLFRHDEAMAEFSEVVHNRRIIVDSTVATDSRALSSQGSGTVADTALAAVLCCGGYGARRTAADNVKLSQVRGSTESMLSGGGNKAAGSRGASPQPSTAKLDVDSIIADLTGSTDLGAEGKADGPSEA